VTATIADIRKGLRTGTNMFPAADTIVRHQAGGVMASVRPIGAAAVALSSVRFGIAHKG